MVDVANTLVHPGSPGLNETASSRPAPGDIAIAVQNVSKMYPLYARPNDRLRQSLWYALPRFLRSRQPPEFYKEFWALRDISFEVRRGEALGIIGRNGSGKSTLLQIIAGTLIPTNGQVQINGRVTALLELGSGFNPEFTGRENVYLNGSILGFSQEEMDGRFDEIAAFADIGQFMDQPVKHYSSGMFVRLAFAVQVCVRPDILIVDEALAVGDVYFQQRCLRRMQEFKQEKGAVVLVTHDVTAAKSFCDRALWLDEGQMKDLGRPEHVVSRYLAASFGQPERNDIGTRTLPLVNATSDHNSRELVFEGDSAPETSIPNVGRRFGDERAEIIGIGVYDENNQRISSIAHGKRISIRVSIYFKERLLNPMVGYVFRNRLGLDLASTNTDIEGVTLPPGDPGTIITVRFVIDLPLLQPGPYSIAATIADGNSISYTMCDWIDDIFALQIYGPETVHVTMRFPTSCYLETSTRSDSSGYN